jgi:hypothetical protein
VGVSEQPLTWLSRWQSNSPHVVVPRSQKGREHDVAFHDSFADVLNWVGSNLWLDQIRMTWHLRSTELEFNVA